LIGRIVVVCHRPTSPLSDGEDVCSEESRNVHVKGIGETDEVRERDVTAPALYVTYIRAMEPCALS